MVSVHPLCSRQLKCSEHQHISHRAVTTAHRRLDGPLECVKIELLQRNDPKVTWLVSGLNQGWLSLVEELSCAEQPPRGDGRELVGERGSSACRCTQGECRVLNLCALPSQALYHFLSESEGISQIPVRLQDFELCLLCTPGPSAPVN